MIGLSTTTAATPPTGVVLLHGLSSSLATVSGLVPFLEVRQIPYEMPTLRGHGSTPAALRGVTWHDWYADAERALDRLQERCASVIVVGLSMGGVVALHLATQRPDVAGVVVLAPALRLNLSIKTLLPLLRWCPLQAKVDVQNAFADQNLAATSTNYPTVPVSAVATLHQFGQVVERELPQVRQPLLVLYTPADRVVLPESAQIAYDRAGTPAAQKTLVAFPRSGHEMLQDCERDAVAAAILDFIASNSPQVPATDLG